MKKKYESLISDIKSSYEKEMKNFRCQVLNEMIIIKDEDLEFNIPLKKKNCFHVKDIVKSKELNGITSIEEIKRVIDGEDFQDMIEVKNTLKCLEGLIEDWKNENLKVDELDQDLQVENDFNEWKSKDHSQLKEYISQNSVKDQFQNFEISKRMKDEAVKILIVNRDKTFDQVLEQVIDMIIQDWIEKNLYAEEMKEFIKMIPIDKTLKIQEMKRNFEWKMLPKWNKRRERLVEILVIKRLNGILIE